MWPGLKSSGRCSRRCVRADVCFGVFAKRTTMWFAKAHTSTTRVVARISERAAAVIWARVETVSIQHEPPPAIETVAASSLALHASANASVVAAVMGVWGCTTRLTSSMVTTGLFSCVQRDASNPWLAATAERVLHDNFRYPEMRVAPPAAPSATRMSSSPLALRRLSSSMTPAWRLSI